MNMLMQRLANITIEIKGCIIAISWHLVCYIRAISCRDMSNFVGISPSFSSIFYQNAHGFINIHEYFNMTILKFYNLLNLLLSKH